MRELQLRFASENGDEGSEFVREGSTELPHLSDRHLDACKRLIEGVSNAIELVVGAASGQTVVQVANPDRLSGWASRDNGASARPANQRPSSAATTMPVTMRIHNRRSKPSSVLSIAVIRSPTWTTYASPGLGVITEVVSRRRPLSVSTS